MEDKQSNAQERAARARNIQRLAAEIIELAAHLNASNDRLLGHIAQVGREKGVPPPRDSQPK